MAVINHGISLRLHHDVYDEDGSGGGGGAVSREISGKFPKWSDMASKVVRYGLETGPIWPPKWVVMISWTTISDHFGSHIRPL